MPRLLMPSTANGTMRSHNYNRRVSLNAIDMPMSHFAPGNRRQSLQTKLIDRLTEIKWTFELNEKTNNKFR